MPFSAPVIDILIKPSQVERTGSLLLERGYKLETKRFMFLLKYIYKDETFRPAGKTFDLRGIELHWDLHLLHGGKTREVGVEDLFQRAIELKTPSLTMRTLYPIPPPTANKKYSGKLHLRLSPELHERLSIKAIQKGESLNKLINKGLTSVI